MNAWLGVASAEHVQRGASLGIAQIGHGKRPGLARMHPGDTLVYYSPMRRLGDTTGLRQFTAYGQITDEEIWQADEGGFRPYRRRASYLPARPVALDEVKARLDLTASPSWGYQLRRGLVPLSPADAETLHDVMCEKS